VPQAIRILHVGDDPELGKVTATYLERGDDRFEVRTATSAAEGLGSIEDLQPDCIVSDYDMPGRDGIEFLRMVREEYPELPFILLTGKGGEAVAGDAISAGATDYLRKGSGTDQYGILANRIGNAVEQYRSNRRAATLERARQLGADVTSALVRAGSARTIETRVCEVISGAEPYVATCIAGVDRERMAVKPRTWAGDTGGYFQEFGMAIDEDSPGRHAPEGRAVHDRDIAVSKDIREDEGYAPWREQALRRGFRSLAAVPIEYEGESYGLLVAFAARPDAFDRTEREVLTELADDTAHALHSQSLRMELERTNAELSSIMRHVPVGLILMEHADGEFRYHRSNRRMAELTGLQREEMRDETLREALGAEMVDRCRDCIEREEPIPFTVELDADGERAVREGIVSPITDDGAVEQLVAVVEDVTGRKQREQELGEITSQYAALVDHFPDGGVFLFDEDLRYVRAGGDELTEVGLSSAEFDGRTPHDLFPEAIAEETARYYRATLDGERHTFRQQYQGESYEVRTIPIRDDTGSIRYGMAVSRNITQAVERNRELERQNERLEEFAGVVSHDLRNPLRTASRRLELAREECDCGTTHLADAADAIDRSQALVEDLLTLARAGDTVGTLESVSLSALAEECWAVVPEGEATLTVPTSRTVSADRGRLRQLLENLLANSVEHGDGAVTVTVGDLPDGFYVEDDGVGIPEPERADVFGAGYSGTEGGTGFGLRIVEQIVDAHGWDILVTDGEDGGARFEITGVGTGPA